MEKSLQRANRIHLAASIIPPLALLISLSYTMMYRAAGPRGRWGSVIAAVAFFVAGYYLMKLQEKLFRYPRTDFDIDDGLEEVTKHYVLKRFLVIPAILSAVPGFLAVPLVDKEIRRLVDIGQLDYYSENFVAPWLVCAIVIVATLLGASARMQPGNITVTPFAVMAHGVCHAGIFIINLFMEVPSILPTLLFAAMIVVSLIELNASFVEDICRKVGDSSGLIELRNTNFTYVKHIAVNFVKVFVVPFILTAAADMVWQYLLEHALNQPL